MGTLTRTRKIICENSFGYKLEFSYSFPFFLSSYSGIHEYSGNVATMKSAFGIGVSYIDTSVNKRDINLVVSFKDDDLLIERKKQIYNIFPLRDKGTLYFHENGIIRKINYYVEKVEIIRTEGVYKASINLVCPSPYFMDSDILISTLENWTKLLEFPLEIMEEDGIEFGLNNDNTEIEIVNNSHIPYGLTIMLTANGTVVNPILKNVSTMEQMKINYTLKTGESILVATYNNEKSITFVAADGKEIPINNSLAFGTKFLQAKNGVNKFIPFADSGSENLSCSISYYNYYEAV